MLWLRPLPTALTTPEIKAAMQQGRPRGQHGTSRQMAPATASPLRKPTTNNSTPNHVFSARHKSSKRGGGNVGPTNNGGFVPAPVTAEEPLSIPDKPVVAAIVEAPPDSSPREPPHKKKTTIGRRDLELKSFTNPMLEMICLRGHSGEAMGGLREDGNYHGGYDNRHDHEWNQQVYNGRDVHARQPKALLRNVIQPLAPTPGPFVAPPPLRPYGGPMGVHESPAPQYYIPVLPPEPVRGRPFVAHSGPVPPMFYTPQLLLSCRLCLMLF